MNIDVDLYRRLVRVQFRPTIRLSVIDIAPDFPQHVLVFLHGFGGDISQWENQLSAFSTSNRVIGIDMRGHGQSDKPRCAYSMEEMLGDIESVLDTLGITQKVILLGHSFGGAIASEFAITRPKRVERVVLVASSSEFKIRSLYRASLKLPEKVLQFGRPLIRARLGAPAHVLKSMHANTVSRWRGQDRYPKLEVPVLVIRGHNDRVFQKPHFEEVARLINGAEDINVGASGHMVMLERSEATNRAIQRFMSAESSSWSQADQPAATSQRSGLLKERPWLPHYDQGVPYTIAVPNAPVHELLFSSMRRFASKPAVIFEGSRLTYRQLYQQSARFAHALHDLGIGPGDRVMIVLPNLPQSVFAYYGTLMAGGVVVFAPPTQAEQMARQIHQAAPRLILLLNDYRAHLYPALELAGENPLMPVEHLIITDVRSALPAYARLLARNGETAPLPLPPSLEKIQLHNLSDLLKNQRKEAPEIEVAAKSPAVIEFTGGTSSDPKGVALSHRNLVANVLQTRHWINQAEEGRERFLVAVPSSHSYGLTIGLNLPIALGAALILKARFETLDILKTIARHKPTIFPGVPQMFMAINDYPEVRKYGIDSIKICVSGSSPLPVEVQETFEKLTKGRLVEGYGLTEAAPVTHMNPLYGGRKIGSIGIPLPSTEARVVDLPSGKKVVKPGQIGELVVRGPQVMLGYWQDPAATRQVISPDGWLMTGDVALMDEEGYFRIIARKMDMWSASKSSKPIFPRDIEEVLYEIPQVKEAVVILIKGRPVAFIITRQERPSVESVIAYCKRRLPVDLVPRLVIFVNEFPRSFVGKVLRRELAHQHESDQNGEILSAADAAREQRSDAG